MVTLEQVKLLDQRITRTIDYVKKVTDENALLKGKHDSFLKRIKELEKQIQQFNDDQGQIEEKFLSAFSRLNEIEDALGTKKDQPIPEAAPQVQEALPQVPEMYVTQEPADSSNAGSSTEKIPDNELDIF